MQAFDNDTVKVMVVKITLIVFLINCDSNC